MKLTAFLKAAIQAGETDADQVSVILGLADAAGQITHLVHRNGISADLGSDIGGTNSDGDSQKALDVQAEELICSCLSGSGAACLLSEEQEDPVPLNPEGSLLVAVDPLDGSSNISVNVTIGTIFSLLPAGDVPAENTLQPGRNQLAAGFFTYGPQTTLILGLAGSDKARCFVLDPDHGEFVAMAGDVEIPASTNEFAINSAYANHWYPPVQRWMADVLAGKDGPLGRSFRMRWVGSLVADAWRIFRRGGIFLYPGDNRPGNEAGRLRLVYEASPMAFLAEKAGGRASHGTGAILDLVPEHLHQRVPLFFGAREDVERLEKEHQ
ncbi:class 1 fructose-bisphosphatase [Alphaproteobacteria bacterium LSUCC0684]